MPPDNTNSVTDETENPDENASFEPEPTPTENLTNGVVLFDNASLWLFGRDEKMHSFFKIPISTVVEVVSFDDIPDTKVSATEKSDNENTYLHVIYNSVDFWILESLVAQNSTPAVIVGWTRLYKEVNVNNADSTTDEQSIGDNFNGKTNGQIGDDDFDSTMGGQSDSDNFSSSVDRQSVGDFQILPTDTYLKFGTAIALGAETEVFDGRTFEKIHYFDKDLDCVVSAYIEAGKASTKYDDIVVADIVEKLKVTSRATPRNELFLKAEKYNPSAPVKAELENQKVEKISYDYNKVLESMNLTSRYRVNLDELNTVDQSQDPFQ